MTILDAKNHIIQSLHLLYEDREIHKMADMILEKLTSYDKIHLLLNKTELLKDGQENLLQDWVSDLLKHRPIQYVLSESWFMHFPFFVQEGVLIPRPETEELVDWVKETVDEQDAEILDIGTGSGCIAIALDLLVKKSSVYAVDISSSALEIAKKNQSKLKSSVDFFQLNVLQNDLSLIPNPLDIIVSNPPYIKEEEKIWMHPNVLLHEPSIALFVDNADPLIFYKRIADLGRQFLKNGGHLFFEINEQFGKEIVDLLLQLGYCQVDLKKDVQGKDRMIKALWLC